MGNRMRNPHLPRPLLLRLLLLPLPLWSHLPPQRAWILFHLPLTLLHSLTLVRILVWLRPILPKSWIFSRLRRTVGIFRVVAHWRGKDYMRSGQQTWGWRRIMEDNQFLGDHHSCDPWVNRRPQHIFFLLISFGSSFVRVSIGWLKLSHKHNRRWSIVSHTSTHIYSSNGMLLIPLFLCTPFISSPTTQSYAFLNIFHPTSLPTSTSNVQYQLALVNVLHYSHLLIFTVPSYPQAIRFFPFLLVVA